MTNQEKGRDYISYQYQKQEKDIATDNALKIIKMNFQSQIIPETKLQAPDGFTGKYYWIFKEEINICSTYKQFQKIEEKGILSNLFCEAGIILISKPD